MNKDTFQKRFDELGSQYESLPTRSSSGVPETVRADHWNKWAVSSQNLIRAVFGVESPHYENFSNAYNNCSGYLSHVRIMGGIFLSAKEDFEGGYVFDVELRISGEIFGDFVVMAREALSAGQKDVAAVLASAALEDTLKKYASVKGLDINDKAMSEVINGLKSKGLVSGAQKTLLGAMPKFRNAAMHADWDKITAPEVSSVLGFVEQFLLSNYSEYVS